MKTDFNSQLRHILIQHTHGHILLGEAMRQVKKLVYDKRDEFFYQGRIRNAIDRKIMIEGGK